MMFDLLPIISHRKSTDFWRAGPLAGFSDGCAARESLNKRVKAHLFRGPVATAVLSLLRGWRAGDGRRGRARAGPRRFAAGRS
jgi:hypothetical protein